MTLKRLLALLLATALLGSLPVLAAGDEAPLPKDEFTLGEASEYGEITILDDTAAAAPAENAAAPSFRRGAMRSGGVPASYDPRESGSYLTPVRTQGAWNTCWIVAAMGAAEADGLKRGLLATSAQETDLSERHLVYFFSHQADDPLGNSSQDYNVSPSFWIQNGGNPVIATMALAGWHGAADEAATNSPYSGLKENDSLDPSYAYTDELHLENTYAVDISTDSGRTALKSMILEHGGAVLCLYYNASYLFAGSPSARDEEPDPDEGPMLDGSEEPTDETTEETAPAETPQEPDAADDDGAEPLPAEETAAPELPEEPEAAEASAEEIPEDPDHPEAPEETALEPDDLEEDAEPSGGTVGLDGAPGEEEDPPAEDEETADDFTVCYYQNTATTTNHEVLIVGWDDDYPAGNFALSSAGAAPSQNGAWLCRNSHGGSWFGGDGYFWVSYYDVSVSASTSGSISGRATVFEFGTPDNYENNYEYDGAAILGYVNDSIGGKGISTASAGADTRRWYANVFTARANSDPHGTESLRAVSTYTYRANVSYTAQVYTDLADPSDPTSGTLAAETSGTFSYAGYHTVVLPESVRLWENETYSVVFRVGRASDNSIYVPACYTSSNWKSTNETLEGQSFVSLNGADWLDCAGLKNEPNVRIKAFTDNAGPVFPFADVAESAWYYEDVETSWRRGLVNGVSVTVYEPNAAATRAQVVTVLWRLEGEPAPAAEPDFSDTESGTWYADAVAWAAENGIVNGYGDGRFRPDTVITRQEYMAILCRYAEYRGRDTSARTDLVAYRDAADVGDWAKDAVSWSIASGVMQGVESSSGVIYLDPRGCVTRAQLAAFLTRFADMLPN